MRLIKIFILSIGIIMGVRSYSQTPSNTNTFPSNNPYGPAAIASTTNSSYKLSINGAVKQYGTGLNSVTSPTLFLQNTTASTGKHFGINASDAGALQIVDVNAANAIRFTISSGGNIGIGTNSPSFNLDVNGTGRFMSSVTGNSIIKAGGTASQFLKADGSVDANTYITANQPITISGDGTGTGTTSLPLVLNTVNNNVGSFTNANITVDAKGRITAASNGTAGAGVSGSGTMNYISKFIGSQLLGNSIIYDNGTNAGINTTLPISPLQVNGNLTVGNSITNAGVVGTVQLTTGGGSPVANRLTFGTDGTGWKFAISKNQGGAVSDYLIIQDNGNVGIGNSSPNYNLDVNGNARFTSSVTGSSIIKSGGTASQFLKADGSIDASTYLIANQNITATGDVTGTGTTTLPLTLATVNNNVGSFTNANITVDSKGRITAASNGSSSGGGIGGTGAINYIPKFSTSQVLTNSLINDNGTNIGIGVTNPTSLLHLPGTGKIAIGLPDVDNNAGISISNNAIKFRDAGNYYMGLKNIGYNIAAFEGYGNSLAGFMSNSLASQYIYSLANYKVAVIRNGQFEVSSDDNSFPGVPFLVKESTAVPDLYAGMQVISSKVFNPEAIGITASSIHISPRRLTPGHATGISFGSQSYPDAAQAGIYSQFTNSGSKLFLGTTDDYSAGVKSRLVIDNNGAVGIGINSPNANAKLDVNGSIYSNGKIAVGPSMDWTKISNYTLAVNGTAIFNKAVVKLYSSWADYVFEKNYKLPTLDEVEKFIQVNKHLPELPSAAEVEKNGIDLGENQVLLVKKIEELTLIIIDQNKRIKALEEKSKN